MWGKQDEGDVGKHSDCRAVIKPVSMGVHDPLAADDGSCPCCGPGSRRELQTNRTALPIVSCYAFILAISAAYDLKLPREVLQRIFDFAAVYERRVVVVAAPSRGMMPAARRRTKHLGVTESSRDISARMGSMQLDEFAMGDCLE